VSAHGPRRLTATADRTSIVNDDSDLSFVTIELRDASGTLVAGEDVVVGVTVEGAGELKAFGSARADNAERFNGGIHTTFDGRALAIVRPTGVGEVTVTASAAGFEPAIVALVVGAAPH